MFLLYVLAGVFAGILGGMGMGGGTVLIPILSVLFKTEQHLSQAINLIAFIPTAIISIIIHSKNGLIKLNGIVCCIVSGIVSALIFSTIARSVNGEVLKRVFGGFLTILSVYLFVSKIRQKDKK